MFDLILVGAGGHAISCIEVIESMGKYKIAGVIDKRPSSSDQVFGYPVLGSDQDLKRIRSLYDSAIIAIGQIKTAMPRIRCFDHLCQLGYHLPILVSPRAYVSPYAKIGKGTVVFHDAFINAGAVIGENCIINTKALIEHDVKVGDHCHISTSAVLNGNVSVGRRTFVGSGVITKQSIVIGTDCVIGAGAVIKRDLTSNCLVK